MQRGLTRPPKGWANDDTIKRQEWVKNHRDVDYSDEITVEPRDLQGIIEHHVGFTQIPTAIASPLVIDGDYAQGTFMVPVCTLEGTLVYSLTKGMMATAEHGITTRHLGQKVSRAPIFMLESVRDIAKFQRFVDREYERIKQVAESTTRYGTLLAIEKIAIHNGVILDMVFSTGNAAGQNMVTFAAGKACEYIAKRFAIKKYYLESGLNSDKKASRRTMATGRGHSVVASVDVKEQTLTRLLRVPADEIVDWPRIGGMVSQVTGSFGLQLHIANALAAMYLALGQDVACVAENSLGDFTCCKSDSGDGITLYQTLPALTVGTVGGGTGLPSQQRNLRLIGCHEGRHSAHKLAEIICGVTLCLELSLLSAIVSNTFSEAHRTFGRNNGRAT